MNRYTIGSLYRVNKVEAERFYYSNMGVYLINKNMRPDNYYQKPVVFSIINTQKDFDDCVANFEYYNGKAWYWAEKTAVTYMSKRNFEYKVLKTVNQVYKHLGVDLNKEPDYFDKHGMPNSIATTNVIYDYIIKYRLIDTNPANKSKAINYILDILEKFGMDGYKHDEVKRKELISIMKYMGFSL